MRKARLSPAQQSAAPAPSGTWPRALAELQTVDGLFAVDERQRIIYWSPAAERILGRPAAEVLGRPCQDVIGGRDERNARVCRRTCRVLRNAVRGRATPDYDLLVQTGRGASRWINVSIALAAGGDPCVIHLFRDVTERRGLEERARRTAQPLAASLRSRAVPAAATLTAPGAGLTNREKQVLCLLAAGLGTRGIAEALGVSPITARNHVTNVMTKLDSHSRLQAVLTAAKRGLI